MTTDPYAAAAASAARLAQLTGQPAHDIAVVLGSGWAAAADALTVAQSPASAQGPATGQGPASTPHSAAGLVEVALSDLGGFPEPTVTGHVPTVRSIAVGGRRVLVFLGRTHLYEGRPVAAVVHGVRTAVAAGCRVIVLTNAAGGIRDGLPGRPAGADQRPPEPDRPLTAHRARPPDGYAVPVHRPDRPVRQTAARRWPPAPTPSLAEGVYAALPGPHFETPAEIRMLRSAGADLVGMSTALEAIAARHLGAEVLGISLVSNPAAGLSAEGLDHADVIAVGQAPRPGWAPCSAQILPGVG